MINEIGETAGEIWTTLSEEGKPVTVSQLKKKTKLPESMLYMGIGWLAREDKLQFSGASGDMEIGLK